METAPYPAHWEADVVLVDGRTAHLRPIGPSDAQRLLRFYDEVSPQSKYYRFFAPHPTLSPAEVARFTTVDHVDRVAFIALVGQDMVGEARYEVRPREGAPRLSVREAEVAFLVTDAHQGRGLGSVLLEHLAAAARERGVQRFVAEVLQENRRMIGVFRDVGYTIRSDYGGGVVSLVFDLTETETSYAVRQAREHRAEARSVARLLHPWSVAVIGAGRDPRSVGHTVLRHLLAGGFCGPVHVVHPKVDEVAGVPTYPSLLAVPGDVDLAVVAVPRDAVEQVVAECAEKRVRGLLVVSEGFGETGDEPGRARQQRLVRLARSSGMRVVGPNSFGLLNTTPECPLNASLSPVMPGRGPLGFFSQSGALAAPILAAVDARGLGLSSFVSAGNRADVSGNDLLQYWEDDPGTAAVLLHLESIGNPRKFSRLARRVGRVKPVVAVKSGRSTQGVPLGHHVRESRMPDGAVDALFRQAGVIRVDDVSGLLDVAQLLVNQPLPTGSSVYVLTNSAALGLLTADAVVGSGLQVVGEPVALPADARAEDFERALAAALDDPAVDAVVTVFVPPLLTLDEDVARVVATAGSRGRKPIVSSFLAMRGADVLSAVGRHPAGKGGRDGGSRSPKRWTVPSYQTPEDAVRALAAVREYAEWLARPVGRIPSFPGLDETGAARLVGHALAGSRDQGPVELDGAQVISLLDCYGIALAAGPPAGHTVAVTVVSNEDPLFGPVVSFGLSGLASELLGDRAYAIPPLEDLDAARLIRSVRAAPLLSGYGGAPPTDLAALEELVLRVSRLADDLPEVAELRLEPVLVAPEGLAVIEARCVLSPPLTRTDREARALPG